MAKFKAKPFKSGGSWVIVLPNDYIKNGLIKTDQELDVDVNIAKNASEAGNNDLLF